MWWEICNTLKYGRWIYTIRTKRSVEGRGKKITCHAQFVVTPKDQQMAAVSWLRQCQRKITAAAARRPREVPVSIGQVFTLPIKTGWTTRLAGFCCGHRSKFDLFIGVAFNANRSRVRSLGCLRRTILHPHEHECVGEPITNWRDLEWPAWSRDQGRTSTNSTYLQTTMILV